MPQLRPARLSRAFLAPEASSRATCALDRTHTHVSLPKLYPAPRAREELLRELRPPVQDQVSRPFWNDTLLFPSYTRTAVSRQGAHSGRHLACPSPSRFSITTTPNSTLSIKISKLAQAPHPPTAPSLSTHKVCPRPLQRPRQQCAHLAQPGRRTPTPEGHPGHLQTVTAPVHAGPPSGVGSP